MEKNDIKGLSVIFQDVKRRFSHDVLVKDSYSLVGKTVFRDYQVEWYFPEVVRSKKLIYCFILFDVRRLFV